MHSALWEKKKGQEKKKGHPSFCLRSLADWRSPPWHGQETSGDRATAEVRSRDRHNSKSQLFC
jgi:hypothetical protein